MHRFYQIATNKQVGGYIRSDNVHPPCVDGHGMQGGRGPDSMKCMHKPSSKCVLFFFAIQLLKKHTLNPEFTLFVSISCPKSPV